MNSFNFNKEDIIEIKPDNFTKTPFDFNFKKKTNSNQQRKFSDGDLLFNKSKISKEVASSIASSSIKSTTSSEASSVSSVKKSKKKNKDKPHSSSASSASESDSASSGSGSTVSDSDEDVSDDDKEERKKSYNPNTELKEKKEILYQLDRLEQKGYKLPCKFNMGSDLDEMKTEYNRIVRNKEVDASVRFQRKMIMAFVSGVEYLNNTYDPFSVKLNGWSENVNDNIDDYDDIFEELHDKYKASGKKMAPELRLMISLAGSGFMFHLTSKMFNNKPMPDVENVLKSDPELMKRFQQAATKEYMFNNNSGGSARPKQNNDASSGGGLFSMLGNMLGGLNTQQNNTYNNANNNKYEKDVDNIIKSVHNDIDNLSVSDEELTSIIEDTADIKILRTKNNNKNNNNRTLNI